MKKSLCTLLALLALGTLPAMAGNVQSHAAIRDAVTAFVQAQTRAIPGKVSIQVAEIDRRLVLPACPALEAFLPPATQLSGNSNVGVRCISQHNWSLFVPVGIKITTTLLATNKTLLQGQTVRAEDITVLPSASLQTGTLTDPAQAVGKILKFGVGAGQVIRQDMLRAPYTVKQGQNVQLRVSGSGFRVSTEGQALNNAAEGDSASARTTVGQIVNGTVKNGIIEISP